jgi:hypothetical protein
MAKGKKTGGRDFKKGQRGGPGAPKLPTEIKEAAKFCRKTLQAKLKEMMVATTDELDALVKDKTQPAVNVIFARLISKAAKGDLACANAVLDRSVGKVKENIEIEVPRPMIIENLEGSDTMLGAKLDDTIDAEVIDNDPDRKSP